MKLTVITINKDNAEGLRETIESVVNQTYTDFEYIVVDGASTDESLITIQQFDNSANRQFNWLSEPDIGVYSAMNKGISKAKGEYLLFLNSGDFLVNSEVLTRIFQTGFSEDIVVGDCEVSKNGQKIFHASPPDDISFAAFYGRTIPHQAAFIRRELFGKFGIYNEGFRIHSDFEFFVKALILNNCTYRHVPVTVSDYNLEGFSSSKSSKAVSEAEHKTVLTALVPPRILSDYAAWVAERRELEPLLWVRSKPFFYFPLMWIFKFATAFVSTKKKIGEKRQN